MISINGFPIDVAVSEEHAYESDITDDPVEVGADVTDDIRAKPAQVTIEGVVSDTPLGEIALDATRQGTTLPSDDALAQFLGMRDAKQVVAITTALRRYESMGLLSFSAPKNAQTGRALRFRAVFKAVVFVANSRTTVRVAVPRSSGKVKRGMKPTFDPTKFKSPIGVEKDSSVAEKLKRWASSAAGL